MENGKEIHLNNYPIFDENYRRVLNTNIIRYFYFQEIGFETVGQFNYELETTMNFIMPVYNLKYKAMQKEVDPFSTINLTETFKRDFTGEGDSTGNYTDWDLYSDTPQGNVEGTSINNLDYLTNATKNKGDSTSKSSQSSNENYTKNTSGYQGVPQIELLNKYLDSLHNIDLEIINELKPLFMGVW